MTVGRCVSAHCAQDDKTHSEIKADHILKFRFRISLDHATVDGEKSLRKFLHNIVTMTSDPIAMDRAAMGTNLKIVARSLK